MNRLPYAIIVILAGALAYSMWQHNLPVDAPVNQWVPAKPAKPVKVSELPKEYQKHKVLAATKCEPDIREHTIITIADPVTGEVTTLDRKEPYRLLAAESRFEARIIYGYRGTERMARLSGSWDAIQIMGWHLGLSGSLDQDFQHMAGISLSRQW